MRVVMTITRAPRLRQGGGVPLLLWSQCACRHVT